MGADAFHGGPGHPELEGRTLMVPRNRIPLLVVLPLFLLSGIAAAGPFRPDLVPADAQWVAHLDLEEMLASRLGQSLLERIEVEGDIEEARTFCESLGFDPLEDLHGVTAFGRIPTDEPHGVVLIQGRLDAKRILGMLEEHGRPEHLEYRDIPFYKWTEPDDEIFFCPYDGDLLLFGNDQESMLDALEVLSGHGESLARRDSFPLRDGTFFTARVTGLARIPGCPPQAQVLRKAEKVAVTVGESAGLDFAEVTVTTSDLETAQQVHDVARGILALGTMVSEEEPELAMLVRAIEVSLQGRNVTLSKSIPVDEILKFLDREMGPSTKPPVKSRTVRRKHVHERIL
jgi:hypothetical protein